MSALTPAQQTMINVLRDLVSSSTTTQSEVSRVTGVHQSQISRILSGNMRRSSKNVQKLCKYAESVASSSSPRESEARVASVLANMTVSSPEEFLALENLVVSLERWRDSWRGQA